MPTRIINIKFLSIGKNANIAVMSGHSKWANIKRKKEVTDAKKGKIFSKMSRLISVAARNGADPDSNAPLRIAVEKAKEARMPKENIDKAIATKLFENLTLEDIDNFITSSHKAIISDTRMLVVHLRKASEGDLSLENTHPFIADDFVFCHNGTIYNSEKLILPGTNYEGTTDSERFFKFILNKINKVSKRRYPEMFKSIIEEIKEKCKFTSLTFLLCDGEHLIGYRNYNEVKEYYTLYYSTQKGLSVVCSEELPGFEWTLLENEEFVVFDKYGVLNEF